MKKRGWRVGLLKEMYPKNPNLLGLNYGSTVWIAIRLRQPFNDSHFIAYSSLLDTLCHELAHIVHSAHDKKFHDLWRELESECEALLLRGVTGLGFLGHGRKLGGIPRVPYDTSQTLIPKTSTTTLNKKFPGKGHQLGTGPNVIIPINSRPSPTVLDQLQRAALTAKHPLSIKSSQALSWCGGFYQNTDIFEDTDRKSKIPKEKVEVIVISDDESDNLLENSAPFWICSNCSCQNPPLFLQCLACIELRSEVLFNPKKGTCQVCTLINNGDSFSCLACENPNSKKSPDPLERLSKKPRS